MRKLEGWKAVVSVPSQRKAWEVYLLEVYYPDDPTRLCRPKAGQSLVSRKMSPNVAKGAWKQPNWQFSLNKADMLPNVAKGAWK